MCEQCMVVMTHRHVKSGEQIESLGTFYPEKNFDRSCTPFLMCIFVPFFCDITITNVGLQCNVNMSFTQPVLPANDGLLRALYFLAQLFFSQIKMPLRLIAGRLARVSSWWTLGTPECRNYTTHTEPFWTRMARHTLSRYRRNFNLPEMTLRRGWPWKILSFAPCSYPDIETVMLIHNPSACCSYL